MTGLPDALRGPWVALMIGGDGKVRSGPGEVERGELIDISVVRGSALPVDGKAPHLHEDQDMLYATDWFSADPGEPDSELETRWEQAEAVAQLLNGLAEPAGPEDADPVWVAEPLQGITMHRIAAGTRRTVCDWAAFGGRQTTAANARERWDARACPRCWRGASS